MHRFDAAASSLPFSAFSLSTHGLGLADALELSRALGALPPKCILYAIEGGRFEAGAPLSPAVAFATEDVARRLQTELEDQSPAEQAHA